jgi:acetyltransferase-like isoleucine patch superfamily enzyme
MWLQKSAGILLRAVAAAGVHVGSAWRVAYCRLRDDGITIGRKVHLASGASLRCSDGGTMVLHDGVSIGENSLVLVKGGRLEIGRGSSLGRGGTLCALESVVIGSGCLLAEYVTVRDQDHLFAGSEGLRPGFATTPVRIGDRVWLGAKSTVTRGVEIGDGCVVGANAVVTRSLAPNSLAVGCPARVLRILDRSVPEIVR